MNRAPFCSWCSNEKESARKLSRGSSSCAMQLMAARTWQPRPTPRRVDCACDASIAGKCRTRCRSPTTQMTATRRTALDLDGRACAVNEPQGCPGGRCAHSGSGSCQFCFRCRRRRRRCTLTPGWPGASREREPWCGAGAATDGVPVVGPSRGDGQQHTLRLQRLSDSQLARRYSQW
jgi:hypothetical protein